ncbi:C40 family peptidase [Mesonia sp. HuA40]|uniref:C40 family peptidase n=1 Tax=Mesonia sp. HuA40 TaxID=2602761 RepID=UPI0011CC1B2F|nr:C40 family peptidase [Mesonia sp. HuA40]TXK71593.1 NlpC/P60 family protein [Mesonia sp. HuA40]
MKIKAFSLLLLLILSACGSKREVASKNYKNKTTAEKIISHARSFEGTPYKFGGTTKRGMDCSGLIYTSFLSQNISLPRVSSEMAKKGKTLRQREIRPGDLVFFRTNKRRRRINHVGLVVNHNKSGIYFIHSSTSRGVIVSKLEENYWKKAYVLAKRIL